MSKRLISMLSILIVLCMVRTLLPTTIEANTYTDYNQLDTFKWSLSTLDGGSINESTYEGKLRFFLFVLTNCPNSTGAVKSIANSEWITNQDVEVIVVFDDRPIPSI